MANVTFWANVTFLVVNIMFFSGECYVFLGGQKMTSWSCDQKLVHSKKNVASATGKCNIHHTFHDSVKTMTQTQT